MRAPLRTPKLRSVRDTPRFYAAAANAAVGGIRRDFEILDEAPGSSFVTP
jgi:hypothetical protein